MNLLQRILRAIRGPSKRIGRPPLHSDKIAAIREAPSNVSDYDVAKRLGVSTRSVRKYRHER